jgi:hypothetical protein
MKTFSHFMPAPDEDAGYLMSNVGPEKTGLPFVVWISLNIGDQYDVRVWVSHTPKRSRLVAVAIRPSVRVVGRGTLSAADLALIRQWVELNRDVIVRHWDGDIFSSADALDALKPLHK